MPLLLHKARPMCGSGHGLQASGNHETHNVGGWDCGTTEFLPRFFSDQAVIQNYFRANIGNVS